MTVTALANTKADITTNLYINGKSVRGEESKAVAIVNPYDNSEICSINPASNRQVDNAVASAYDAFRDHSWTSLTGRDRGALLFKLATLLREDLEAFAIIETMDTGIPIRETRMEVATSAMHIVRALTLPTSSRKLTSRRHIRRCM